MKYHRMPIEIEAPEQIGYDKIKYNLAESSVTDAIFQDLDLNLNDLVICYGHHVGKPELRQLIASEYSLSADQVLLTAGAATALFIISTSLLSATDHLLVVRPNYATNIETPRAIGCEISYLDLTFAQGFKPDLRKMAALIQKNTRLISITYPHNPTGTMISPEELKQIIRLAEENNCFLLVDETYRDLTFGEKLPLAATLSANVISVSSVSKAFGLPGIRLGWLICQNQELMETFLAAKEQIYICNSVVDEEIAWLFLNKKEGWLKKIQAQTASNFQLLKAWMSNNPYLEWVEPAGGVVCFPRIKSELNLVPEDFYRLLNEKYETFVGPGHWFEMDKRYMRIGFGWTDSETLHQGLKNISLALAELVS